MLSAWIEQGLPVDFDSSGIRPALNRHSGYVFLTNDDYSAALLNGDKLESFYFLPYCGEEGFLADLIAENNPAELHQDDVEFLLEVARITGYELPKGRLPYPLSLL